MRKITSRIFFSVGGVDDFVAKKKRPKKKKGLAKMEEIISN